MRPLWGKNYVRVQFTHPFTRTRLYTYYCPGARVGDTVLVPPSRFAPWEQHVQVIAIGRRWWGRIKEARLA